MNEITSRVRVAIAIVAVLTALPVSSRADQPAALVESAGFAREALHEAGLIPATAVAPTDGRAVGDLDADGDIDVAVVHQTAAPGSDVHRIEVIARSVATDELLWTTGTDAFDAIVLEGRDVSGDGRVDPLLLLLRASGTSVGWDLSVWSGADGSALWSRRVADVGDTSPAAAVPFWAGDLDGDGAPDIAVNGYEQVRPRTAPSDFEETTIDRVVAGENGFDAAATDVTAAVVSGRSGATLHERTVSAAWAELVPQPSSGGRWSLFWYVVTSTGRLRVCPFYCLYPGPSIEDVAMQVASIDTTTFATLWSHHVHEPFVGGHKAMKRLGDLDADGIPDPMIVATAQPPVERAYEPKTYHLFAISGATGTQLWQRTVVRDRVVVLGNIGGAPGADLVVVGAYSYREGSTYWTDGVIMHRLDGATGTILSSTKRSSGSALQEFGDVDGDGITDVLLQGEGLESGATGAWLYRTGLPAVPIGDVDGDSVPDLLTVSSTGSQLKSTITVDAVRVRPGSAGQRIWRATHRGRSGLQVVVASSVAAVGGADLLLLESQPRLDAVQSRLSAVDGSTGAAVWRLGILEFSGEPGTLSGTAIDERGAPLRSMCVMAAADAGARTNAYTDKGGAFRFADLPAAAWRIYVTDCGPREYAAQWYDGASDESAGTPVVVQEGGSATITVRMRLAPEPRNDAFAAATPIAAVASDEQDATYARIETGETAACGMQRTIWYRFEPLVDGSLTVTTLGSRVRSAVAVYRGASLDALTPLGCSNSVAYPTVFGGMSVRVSAGQTYHVQIGSRDGERGTLQMNASFDPGPAA